MGSGANVNAFFGITTMIISIPTGVKIFNWLFTMFRGRATYTVPMLWLLGFLITFTIGGMTGVLMSVPGADFQLHNSVFLVAHFHNTIIGGVVFGYFAGIVYWFPKAIGFKLNEKLGKFVFWCWLVGFFTAFMPLYVLGLMGMTRRLNHYDASTGWHPFLIVAAIGALIIFAGILGTLLQFAVSFLQRKNNMDVTGDPWDGRTLEWTTSSPPPFYNFAHIPVVTTREPFWDSKVLGLKDPNEGKPYEDIHMPKSTSLGIFIGVFGFLLGFGLIWYIWWMAIVGLLGVVACIFARSFNYDTDYYVPASEVEKIEKKLKGNN